RFFTLEQYKDCTSGGLVYYNDTRKKLRVFAGIEGEDQEPQNEISLNEENDVLSFKGKFIYAASDDVIAYPGRNVNYKYGYSTHFIVYKNIQNTAKKSAFKVSPSSYYTVIVSDGYIYIQGTDKKSKYERHKTGLNDDKYHSVDFSELHFNKISQDNKFHCNNNIKPRSIKYISH
ncbi:T6SS immunity protein Tli3 family protein, partial [Chimaeribacter arupi]|uniref:T6SS immunity protein Tli3 family protein n=1 Tax=Chimaeribacter arupi TaxID=2060066 RepID=UPI000CC3DC90